MCQSDAEVCWIFRENELRRDISNEREGKIEISEIAFELRALEETG